MNTTYDPITNTFALDIGSYSVLPQLVWVVTDNCPNDCPFCFQPKTGVDFNVDNLPETIQMFKKLGVQKIDISGGEPLNLSNISLICETLRSEGIHITLTTNGIGQKDNKKWLSKNCKLFSRVMFSINGFDETSHDTLCTVPGTFVQTLDAIKSLALANYSKVRINTVITQELLPAENQEKILNIIRSLEPEEWCLIQPHPENKKSTFDLYNITSAEFAAVISSLKSKSRAIKSKMLIRTIDNYRGYWVLYPNGIIRKHVDNPQEVVEHSFHLQNLATLINSISGTLWLPKQENDL